MELNLEEIEDEAKHNWTTPEQREKYLKDSGLFYNLVKEVQKSVVGEEKTILAIGLISFGRLVSNANKTSYNLIPNDVSGAGKDYITKKTLEVFVPSENLIILSRISATALNYYKANDPLFSYDGVVLFLQDISGAVLNSEVVKTFLSDNTKAVVVKDQKAVELNIKGKPVFVATTANSIPENEMLRRLTLLPLDISEEQTKKIKRFKARQAAFGKKQENDELLRGSIKHLKQYDVLVPYAEELVDYFPDNTITRTSFEKFIDWIKASAVCYQFQREKTSEGWLIANGIDYNLAREAFLIISQSGNLIPVTRNEKQLLETINEKLDGNTEKNTLNDPRFWSLKEIEEKYIGEISHSSIWKTLQKLTMKGFLEMKQKVVKVGSSKKGEEGNEQISYSEKEVPAYKIVKNDSFVLPLWAELLRKRNERNDGNEGNKGNEGNVNVVFP